MSITKKISFVFVLVITILIVAVLGRSLFLDPNRLPSTLIGKQAPELALPTLYYPDRITSNKDFLGHITLLNVWASWCRACLEEHAFLMELGRKEYLTIYGLNYKDNEENAKKYLQDQGNPYKWIAVDPKGQVAIDWGVYGSPETFLIDKKGKVRYRQVGALTPKIWEETIYPIVEAIQHEE